MVEGSWHFLNGVQLLGKGEQGDRIAYLGKLNIPESLSKTGGFVG